MLTLIFLTRIFNRHFLTLQIYTKEYLTNATHLCGKKDTVVTK